MAPLPTWAGERMALAIGAKEEAQGLLTPGPSRRRGRCVAACPGGTPAVETESTTHAWQGKGKRWPVCPGHVFQNTHAAV